MVYQTFNINWQFEETDGIRTFTKRAFRNRVPLITIMHTHEPPDIITTKILCIPKLSWG